MKTILNFRCGHTAEMELRGPDQEREKAHYENIMNGLCLDCYELAADDKRKAAF